MAALRVPSTKAVNAGSIDPEITAPERPAGSGKRAEFNVAAAPDARGFGGPVILAVGFIALAGLVGLALRAGGPTEDPNFVRARDSLARYELGRTETERNYDDPLYDGALADLAKVDANSSSVTAAQTLASEITLKREAFRKRIQARETAAATVQQEISDRESESLAAHQMNLLMPKKDFPECKEGPGHAH